MLSSHRTDRERRAVEPLFSLYSDGFIATFPESRGRGDLFAFMRLCYISLCSRASVGIAKAAMVHQHDLSSHRTGAQVSASVSPLEPRTPQSTGACSRSP